MHSFLCVCASRFRRVLPCNRIGGETHRNRLKSLADTKTRIHKLQSLLQITNSIRVAYKLPATFRLVPTVPPSGVGHGNLGTSRKAAAGYDPNKPVSQSCAVAKSGQFWRATGQSNLAYKRLAATKASKVWFSHSHNCTLANGAVFHSVC